MTNRAPRDRDPKEAKESPEVRDKTEGGESTEDRPSAQPIEPHGVVTINAKPNTASLIEENLGTSEQGTATIKDNNHDLIENNDNPKHTSTTLGVKEQSKIKWDDIRSNKLTLYVVHFKSSSNSRYTAIMLKSRKIKSFNHGVKTTEGHLNPATRDFAFESTLLNVNGRQ